MYAWIIVQPIPLHFLKQEVTVKFQQLKMYCKMFNNFPGWPNWPTWDMMGLHLTHSVSQPTTLAVLCQLVKDAWNNVSQDIFYHLYEVWQFNTWNGMWKQSLLCRSLMIAFIFKVFPFLNYAIHETRVLFLEIFLETHFPEYQQFFVLWRNF